MKKFLVLIFILLMILSFKFVSADVGPSRTQKTCEGICFPTGSATYRSYENSNGEWIAFDRNACIDICLGYPELTTVTEFREKWVIENNIDPSQIITPAPTPSSTPTPSPTPISIGPGKSLVLPNPLDGVETVWDLLGLILRWLIWISAPIAVIMILIAAITLITSSGEKEKLKKAKDTILYALLGFAVVLLANGIPPLIEQILSSGQKKTVPTETCKSLNGTCKANGTCRAGESFGYLDCFTGQTCCKSSSVPIDTCKSLGGECKSTASCDESWGYYPDCSTGEECCKTEIVSVECDETICPGCEIGNIDANNIALDDCITACIYKGSDTDDCIANCTMYCGL
ncbi:MAG: pilin [Candidatus Parcubacteria bacterium]|nr:pilin [Candidatus Parcubacteria bacterium]